MIRIVQSWSNVNDVREELLRISNELCSRDDRSGLGIAFRGFSPGLRRLGKNDGERLGEVVVADVNNLLRMLRRCVHDLDVCEGFLAVKA
ncbi:hypothetical protein [Ralstonia solanacearum]|uniref:hypothetical protein n=1 Tax=Ralstonia solanacearum TaxID=305 RepID=UPI002480F127|nr:hypothetical protein [Ralstonia solanacearum]